MAYSWAIRPHGDARHLHVDASRRLRKSSGWAAKVPNQDRLTAGSREHYVLTAEGRMRADIDLTPRRSNGRPASPTRQRGHPAAQERLLGEHQD
jgi:hypothetical protein